jgi:hypothetical protein
MAKKAESPKPTTWTIYKIAAKAVWLGTVEAADEGTAIEKAAAEFKVPATRHGGQAMSRRKGEITRADLQQNWPHHVALQAERCAASRIVR